MAEGKPIRNYTITNRTKCRLVAMTKKKTTLKNAHPLCQGSELLARTMSLVAPDLKKELDEKMKMKVKTGSIATKRWDVLFEIMDENASLVNILWELIVIKDVGRKGIQGCLLEEYQKKQRLKFDKDLQRLRLSKINKKEVGNYLLMRLDEYQYDLCNVSAELDEIDEYVNEIWSRIGRGGTVSPRYLPDTENIEHIVKQLRDNLKEMSIGIQQGHSKDSSKNMKQIKELEATIEEISEALQQAQSRNEELERQNSRLSEDSEHLHKKVTQLEIAQQQSEAEAQDKEEKIDQLERENDRITGERNTLRNEKDEMRLFFQNETTKALTRMQQECKKQVATAIRDVSNAHNNRRINSWRP